VDLIFPAQPLQESRRLDLRRLFPNGFTMATKVFRKHDENFLPIPNFNKSVATDVSNHESHQFVCRDCNHGPLIIRQNSQSGSFQREGGLQHRPSFLDSMKRSEGQLVGLAVG
jgi:hypothetical protein